MHEFFSIFQCVLLDMEDQGHQDQVASSVHLGLSRLLLGMLPVQIVQLVKVLLLHLQFAMIVALMNTVLQEVDVHPVTFPVKPQIPPLHRQNAVSSFSSLSVLGEGT